jgi:hypothetical protein
VHKQEREIQMCWKKINIHCKVRMTVEKSIYESRMIDKNEWRG